ncbi:MAG: hypothetical protein HOP29_01690 [Phycisphaerales bacterium]|nr:hypothetical protein [Phycisphaerales bacterium]
MHHPIYESLRSSTLYPQFSFSNRWSHPACNDCHYELNRHAGGLQQRIDELLKLPPTQIEDAAKRTTDHGAYALAAPLDLILAGRAKQVGDDEEYWRHLAYAMPVINGIARPTSMAGFIPPDTHSIENARFQINLVGFSFACKGREAARAALDRAQDFTTRHQVLRNDELRSLFHRRRFNVSNDVQDIKQAQEVTPSPYCASTHHALWGAREATVGNPAEARRQFGLSVEQGPHASLLYRAMQWWNDALLDWNGPNSAGPVYKNLIKAQYAYVICYLGHKGIATPGDSGPFCVEFPGHYLQDSRWAHHSNAELTDWRKCALIHEGPLGGIKKTVNDLLYGLI